MPAASSRIALMSPFWCDASSRARISFAFAIAWTPMASKSSSGTSRMSAACCTAPFLLAPLICFRAPPVLLLLDQPADAVGLFRRRRMRSLEGEDLLPGVDGAGEVTSPLSRTGVLLPGAQGFEPFKGGFRPRLD